MQHIHSDGRIAFVSDRSGSREIWLANRDGSGQVRVTNLNGPPIDGLVWNPDGRQLAYESRLSGRAGIFVLECNSSSMSCSEPKRLTAQDTPGARPAWSQDGRSLYFVSQRSGQPEIWKRPALGGEMTQITHGGAYMSRESPDGKWLYFSRQNVEGIFRQSLAGADRSVAPKVEQVVGSPYRVQPGGWAVTRDEVIFIDRANRHEPAVIRAWNLTSKSTRSIVSLPELFADRDDIGLSVSPDGKWILYSQLDRSGSNIMVAENR